jgi:hypothetical protein
MAYHLTSPAGHATPGGYHFLLASPVATSLKDDAQILRFFDRSPWDANDAELSDVCRPWREDNDVAFGGIDRHLHPVEE